MAWAGVEERHDAELIQQLRRLIEVHFFAVVVGFDASDGYQIGIMPKRASGAALIAEYREFPPRQRFLGLRRY